MYDIRSQQHIVIRFIFVVKIFSYTENVQKYLHECKVFPNLSCTILVLWIVKAGLVSSTTTRVVCGGPGLFLPSPPFNVTQLPPTSICLSFFLLLSSSFILSSLHLPPPPSLLSPLILHTPVFFPISSSLTPHLPSSLPPSHPHRSHCS